MTQAGTPCHWPKGRCEHHTASKPAQSERPRNAPTPPADRGGPKPLPDAVADRDLAGLGWWTIEHVLLGDLESPRASIVATLVRVLASLDGFDDVGDYGIERTALEARLANGLMPEGEEQWAQTARIVDPETLAHLRERQRRSLLPPDAPVA